MNTQQHIDADDEENRARALNMLYTRGGRTPTADERHQILEAARNAQRARGESNFTQAFAQLTSGMWDERALRGNSLGSQFVRGISQWTEQTRGRRSGQWTSPVVALDIMATTLTESPTSGGAAVRIDHRADMIVPLPLRVPTVADLLSEGETNSNAVSYPREKTYTMAAATVAEGAAKPESAIVLETASDKVEKIAHWLPVTEELLDDAPAMRAYLDARLRQGVLVTEDDQLLNGDGVAPNLLGLMNRTGLAAAVARGTDTNADAIAKQMGAIAAATNLVPTGIIMHPTNWLSTLLGKDTSGQYISGAAGPFGAAQVPTLWGRPVAVTNTIALGTALVVCRIAAMVLRRSPLTVAATNSHQDFFVKNLIAIRAEQRETLAVMIPAAFGKVTGLN